MMASIMVVGCRLGSGGAESTEFNDRQKVFKEAVIAATPDRVVPDVPADLVVLDFHQTDDNVFVASYLRPDNRDGKLWLDHVVKVCAGTEVEAVSAECSGGVAEPVETGGGFLAVVPHDVLASPVTLTASAKSIEQAFYRGWELWAPESVPTE